MMFNILKDYHCMIGIPIVESHDVVFPPGVPAKKIPHTCGAVLCLGIWGFTTGLPNGDVLTSGSGRTLSRGSDIGPLIPHINIPPAPPNLLLPVILLASGSKSHFGAHSHMAEKGPVAFACLKVVNLNLNCAGPTMPPLPSGLVLTFNTNTTGVTVGDLVAGALSLVFDAAVQFGINRLFAGKAASKVFGAISNKVAGAILPKIANGGLLRLVGVKTVGDLVQSLGFPVLGQLAENALPLIVADVIGSPVGYSWGPVPVVSQGLGGSANFPDQQQGVQQAVDNYFNSPSVEQHPSQPPADTSAQQSPGSTPSATPDQAGPPTPASTVPVDPTAATPSQSSSASSACDPSTPNSP